MSKFIFCTLANNQIYRNHQSNDGGVPVATGEVLIKGGAGVANDRLITPYGVMTEVSDEQYALLENNSGFQLHKKNGHIVVRDRKADAEKVATDMNDRDPSKPLTPADYLDKQIDAVTSGGAEVLNKKDAE